MRLSALVLAALLSVAAGKSQLYERIETEILALLSSDAAVAEYLVAGDSHAAHLERLLQFAKRRGVALYLVPLAKDTRGAYAGLASCPNGRACVVLINNSTDANGQLHVLLHELAHLEHLGKVSTRVEAEVFAETVAHLALTALGVEASRVTISYLAHHTTQDARIKVLRTHGEHVERTAQRLVEAAR